MKHILFALSICLVLSGCTSVTETITATDKTNDVNLQTAIIRKDYKPMGRVHAEYSRTCFFLNLFCTAAYYPHNDLIAQAEKLGANEVINTVLDISQTPAIWSVFFSHTTVKANGLAILLTPEDLTRLKTINKK